MKIEEIDLSGGRFAIKAREALEVTDTRRGQTSKYDVLGQNEAAERLLIETLVKVANRQEGDYDLLLNGLEAFDALIVFVKQKFPEVRKSDLLRPLMTLHGATHNLVAGAKADLTRDRQPEQNGAYRWAENHPENFSGGHRPTRTYKDMLVALIMVAYKALLASYNEQEAGDAIGRLLAKDEIGLVNDKTGTGPNKKDVEDWWSRLHEKGRKPPVGRRYCFDQLCEAYEDRLAAAADPTVALTLAAELIDRVRLHQPTGWFVPSRKSLG